MEHCKKLTSWDIYGVRKFPYRGKRKYVPDVNRSFYGTITITNDVFGMTIYQFERKFKACQKRRKEHEQQIMNIRYPDKISNEYLDYLKYGDATIQDQTLSEEYRSYYKLIQAAGTELEIRTTQRLFQVKDKIRNNVTDDNREIHISSGSHAEGIDLPGSDSDVMFELTDITVLIDLKYLFTCTAIGKTTLLMENDDSHPGFCKLKLLAEGYLGSEFVRGCFKEDVYGIYLSTESFVNNWEKICAVGKSLIRHGPCLSDADLTVDISHCLRSKMWPKTAMDWICRHRVGQWPTDNLINTVVSDGCLVVPIGPKIKWDEHFWRISFSLAEKRLIHSMNYTQLLCYVLMKLTLKNVINKRQGVKELLCSYFLKTALFWLSEEIHIDTFKITNLSYCFSLCIDKLMSFVRNCHCPNYFIPQHNMFIGKVDESNNRLLLSVLSELRNTELRLIIDQIPEIGCTMTDKNELSLHLYDRFFEYFSFPFYVDSIRDEVKLYTALQSIKDLIESESSGLIVEVLSYLYADIIQQISQKKFTCLHENYRHGHNCRYHRYIYSRTKIRSNLLFDGTKKDYMSGWLLYASFYYVLGQYKKTLQIVEHVLSRCTPDMLQFENRLNCIKTNQYNYKRNMQLNISLNKGMMQYIHDARFLSRSLLIPKELQLEVQNDEIMVPPVVMGHCLQFLCYHHLGHVNEKRRALGELYQTVKKAYFISEILMPNALVIVGICQEIAGDKDAAYAFYSEAMCPNHSGRKMCPSAQQRLQNLLNK